MPSEDWLIDRGIEEEPTYLYHYTTDNNCLAIIASEQLNLSPLRRANDPYEFGFWLPAMTGQGDGDAALQNVFSLKERINRVAFATDRARPNGSIGSDVNHRGFGSVPMWAHYADGFRGGCLVFDRSMLMEAVNRQLAESSVHREGRRIGYVDGPFDPPGMVVDESPEEYLIKHASDLVFRKAEAWRYENEYRIISLAKVENPQHIRYEKALVGIVLGVRSLLRGWDHLEQELGIPIKHQMFHNARQSIY